VVGMSTVTTARLIDLGQLAAKLGDAPLSISDDGTSRVITCHDETVTQATLQTAVDIHVAIDKQGNADTLRTRAEQALDANRKFMAIASPTNAQVVAQVKALTVQNTAIIRLVIGRLDGLD
jgi:type II secretory ATPase GspE/PulE/Tfp pilus assembly ATPase PilB-like protein